MEKNKETGDFEHCMVVGLSFYKHKDKISSERESSWRHAWLVRDDGQATVRNEEDHVWTHNTSNLEGNETATDHTRWPSAENRKLRLHFAKTGQ